MSSTIKPTFETATDLTFGVASLASDAALLAGRESNEYVNTNLCFDAAVSGFVTPGTTPTAGKRLELWVIAKSRAGTPAYPDVFDGTDSNESVTSRNVLQGICQYGPIWYQTIDSTSNRTYYFTNLSVVKCLGFMPDKFVLFLVHDTVAALHATAGNHSFSVQGMYATAG